MKRHIASTESIASAADLSSIRITANTSWYDLAVAKKPQ